MAKSKTVFSCSNCGSQFPKWAGQCQDCGDWNTLQEEIGAMPTSSSPKAARFEGFAPKQKVQKLKSINPGDLEEREDQNQFFLCSCLRYEQCNCEQILWYCSHNHNWDNRGFLCTHTLSGVAEFQV